jgi:purine-binding chemotaxis protein CheW
MKTTPEDKLQHQSLLEEQKNIGKETFLVFSLNNGMYAAPLLAVREVVEFKTPKPIPHTQDFFMGVTNIRGEIVGVLDLSKRLSGEFCSELRKSMLVVNVEECVLAIVVNTVNQVIDLSEFEIDKKNPAHTSENTYTGIAKIDGELVTILDLAKTIHEKDFAQLNIFKNGENLQKKNSLSEVS